MTHTQQLFPRVRSSREPASRSAPCPRHAGDPGLVSTRRSPAHWSEGLSGVTLLSGSSRPVFPGRDKHPEWVLLGGGRGPRGGGCCSSSHSSFLLETKQAHPSPSPCALLSMLLLTTRGEGPGTGPSSGCSLMSAQTPAPTRRGLPSNCSGTVSQRADCPREKRGVGDRAGGRVYFLPRPPQTVPPGCHTGLWAGLRFFQLKQKTSRDKDLVKTEKGKIKQNQK